MRHYIALIHKDADSDFGVSFPDVPGCVSAGSTLDEARSMATEALAGHLRLMREGGEDWPEPSSLETIMSERENQDAVAFLVSMEDKAAKVLRVNITMPENELAAVDMYAKRVGYTRSNFLRKAALHLIRHGEADILASATPKKRLATPSRKQAI